MKRILVLSAVCLATVLSTTTAARADVSTHGDRARDVQTQELGLSAPKEWENAPSMARSDITKIRIGHHAKTLRIKLTVRDLTRSQGETWFYASVRSNRGERQVAFRTDPAAPNGSAVTFLDGRGNPLTCAGVRRAVDFRADTASISVPRKCLGNPAFVRVLAEVELRVNGRIYQDSAYTNGAADSSAYGPRVYR